MLQKLICILFFNICCLVGIAQTTSDDCDCGPSFGGPDPDWGIPAERGDNYLEINISNREIKNISGENYLYFTIKLKMIGGWYDNTGFPADDQSHLSGLDIRLDFNKDVFGATEEAVSRIENVSYGTSPKMPALTWGKAYAGTYWTNVSTFNEGTLLLALLSFTDLSKKASYFPLKKDSYLLVGEFRWKLKSGVTSGRTGVSLRIPKPEEYTTMGGTGEYPSMAYMFDEVTGLGICVTGESLDIPVGGDEPAPVITKIDGPKTPCSGVACSYTATTDVAADRFAWRVKNAGGTDVTSSVVVGGAINSTTATASFTWQPTASGTYSLCAVAANATGEGAEFCEEINVYGAPALTLTERDNKTSVCPGSTVNLVATTGLTNYEWYKDDVKITSGVTSTTTNYSPVVPTTGNNVTYKVKAQSAQGCPATATLPITITPAPAISVTTIVANGVNRTASKYGVGDHIHMSADNVDLGKYEYTWSDGKGNNKTGTFYDIPSATENKYDITLTIKDRVTSCTSTKTVSLTKDANCGITNIGLAATDLNRICVGGISKITANVTALCDGNTIIAYAWYKDGVKLDSVKVDHSEATNVFTATSAGAYVVKVYTVSGMLASSPITITSNPHNAAVVTAPEYLYVVSGNSTLLTAECAGARTWLWEPVDWLASTANNQQYVETKQLTKDTRYYVYATDQNGCMSMDSTLVKISADAFAVNIVPAAPTICKGGSVTLKAVIVKNGTVVDGGTGGYSYQWTDDVYSEGGVNGEYAIFRDMGMSTTAFTSRRVVTVTDLGTGISVVAQATVNVTTTPEPALTINGGGTICEGDHLQVTGTSTKPSDYTWYIRNNADGSITSRSLESRYDTLMFNTRGEYYVWVAGKTAACTSDTTGKGVAVKVNGFDLAWTIQPANYKLGTDVSGQVQASNGAAPYNFTWQPLVAGRQVSGAADNPNSYQVVGASEANYKFQVKAKDQNSCYKTLEKNVSNTIPGGLVLTLASKSVTQCNGGAALMKATAKGGSNSYTFNWYKVNDEAHPLRTTVLSGSEVTDQYIAGDFTNGDKIVVKVEDNSSPALIRRDTITVNTSANGAPVVYAGDDITIGRGTSTLLFGEVRGGTATEWVWEKASDLASASEAAKQYPKTTNLNAQTSYTVYIKDNAGCVSKPDAVVVSVDNINTFSVSINDPGTVCKGNSVKLAVTKNPNNAVITNWQWVDASGQLTGNNGELPLFAATTDGRTTVYLRVKNSQGLTATASLPITVQNAIAPEIELTGGFGNGTVCAVEALRVVVKNGVPVSNYTWYVGGTEVQSGASAVYRPDVTATSALNIKVKATSLSGCPAKSQIDESITVFQRPDIEWAASSTPVSVLPDRDVKVTAEVRNDDGTGTHYNYVWTHTGDNKGNGYDDTEVAADWLSASSKLNGKSADATQPYYFQVYNIDANGCHSDTISRTIYLNGDAVYVELKLKNDKYCTGGAALLWAEAPAADGLPAGDVVYKWYKDGAVLAGETGKELLVANPVAGTVYKVEVTVNSTGKSGTSNELPLVLGANTAPTLAGDILTIPTGTKTALAATPSAGAVITGWNWSPVDKLASGESTLANPYTTILSTPQVYSVYAVDANGCVTLPAQVTVKVISATKPVPPTEEGQPDDKIFAYVYPSPKTICVGNMLNLQTVVWGNASVGGTTTYEWSPAEHLSAVNIENPVFNANNTVTAPGTYSYIVKVKRGSVSTIARADIVVNVGTLPKLSVDMDNTGMACAGSDIVVKVVNNSSVTIKKYTWIIDGIVDNTVTGDRYTWPAVAAEKSYNVKVIAETEGHCLSNTVEVDSVVKPALKLNDLQVADSCGRVILFSDAGAGARYTWNIKVGAGDLDMVAGKSNDTLYLKQKTASTAVSIPYEVEVSVKPETGGCQSNGSITGKLFFQPKVKMNLWIPDGETVGVPYTMAAKGSTVVASVDDANSNYTVGTNATENWSVAETGDLVAGRGQAKINNIQKDNIIRLTVANKEAATCYAKDSMPVYLYPEAPKVVIDTNTNLADIVVKWDAVEADSVRVMGIVDDAYNVLGSGYKVLASIKASQLKWAEPDMNTRLKFYYLQSVKKIQNKVFVSKVTSDTVGWLKQTLYGKNTFDPSVGAANVIAYPFDMSAKGIRTDRDLFEKMINPGLTKNGGAIGYWSFDNQVWSNDDYVDLLGDGSMVMWMGTAYDLAPGKVYNLVFMNPTINQADILMYGKLQRLKYDLKTNTNLGSVNFVLQPLSMMNQRKRQALGNSIPSNALGPWNFRSQMYDNATNSDILGDGSLWMWMPDEATDTFMFEPLQPVALTMDRVILNWSK